MIERVSELPLFGPEEQIRKFIDYIDEPDSDGDLPGDSTHSIIKQNRIGNLDDMLQKQLIWSYDKPGQDDAYFYWDWCPSGTEPRRWQIEEWSEYQDNLDRSVNRLWDYSDFKGYKEEYDENADEMPDEYDAQTDQHAEDNGDIITNLEVETLRHNIMRSYIEVSEWLGDGALNYGSHNGYVSRKMSLCWLFDAIRALINFKLNNQDRYAEKTIYPLDVDGHGEGFLPNGGTSDCGIEYHDNLDLDQIGGRCAVQEKVRSSHPDVNGTLIVRGNEKHYGERADFYTHNSFVGECRFFHNARFLGQTKFDKEILGTSARARWSDICERYSSDKEYEPGTLMMFGGREEITVSDGKNCNAIVTSKPGFILNGDDVPNKIMLGVALAGIVPVRIVEHVKKFDKLVPSYRYPGKARRKRWYDLFKNTIAIALDDSNGESVKCVTKLSF